MAYWLFAFLLLFVFPGDICKQPNPSMVSIVIISHNEHQYLPRTIQAIKENSPLQMISEIIVVDDASYPPLNTLEYPLDAFSYPPLRIFRNENQEGLIRSKISGARASTGQIIVFLEAHVKTYSNWLQPLMEPILVDYKTIVTPAIPVLNEDYTVTSPAVGIKMLFNWGMTFDWFDSEGDEVPTISGGLFAVSRQWWFEFGELDSGMKLWGGENIEMSLRAWLCGGKIVVARSSRIAHLFRPKFPYKIDDRQVMVNKMRAVNVWLNDAVDDEPLIPWKERVFQGDPNLRKFETLVGDISDRMVIRKKCKNFSFFVDKFQEAFFLRAQMIKDFGLVGINPNSCLSIDDSKLSIKKCDWSTPNQIFKFGAGGLLASQDGTLCLTLEDSTVKLGACHDDSLRYVIKDQIIGSTQSCLHVRGSEIIVLAENCGKWRIAYL